MNVVINGERQDLETGVSVAALVNALGKTPKGLAVAVNGEVVPRSTWDAHALDDGDRIEILEAAQGG